MIYVIATSELKEGMRAEFLEILNANVPNVRAENGCLMYQPAVDFPSGLSKQQRCSPDVVTILEGWESLEALKAHLESEHMRRYREEICGMVRESSLNVVEPAS